MANPNSYRPNNIPISPGVYRFFNDQNRVIYVGKAKNLRARLSTYFQSALDEKVRTMVWEATRVDWTIVGNEIESLQLEFNWIQQERPKYNIIFRDDKSFPYLAVTVKDSVPRIFVTRNIRKDGTKYFGPYPHAWALRELVDILQTIFPLRSCTSGVFARAERSNRACLLGYIGKCVAPCIKKDEISSSEYHQLVNSLISFMNSDPKKLIGELREKMTVASESEDFESAAKLRDQIDALEKISTSNSVALPLDSNVDLFASIWEEMGGKGAITQFQVRNGRVTSAQSWIVESGVEVNRADHLEQLLATKYLATDGAEIPDEILVNVPLEDGGALADLISQRRNSKVEIRVPQRGEKRELLDSVQRNSHDVLFRHLAKRSQDISTRSQALEEIAQALGMDQAPLRIECFDIANMQGSQIVASMVVFEDGVAKKSDYRRFSIQSETGKPNDVAAMKQVLSRRLARMDEEIIDENELDWSKVKFAYPPQLIIVDGGKPQVNAAAEVLEGRDIFLCGLAKRFEEVWLPNAKDPIIFPRNSEALYLFQRIRDEAHRFANTYHRSKRSKEGLASILEEIDGLGAVRRKTLIDHFGSVAKIRAAGVDEIAALTGIGPKIATHIAHALAKEAGALTGVDAATGEILDSSEKVVEPEV
ncbi:MAG: excinuclease ABC subunit UvrC [Actinomycetota bacterium]